MQGEGSRENGKPHPVLWHSAARIASSSPSSSHPVSVSPSQYIGTTPGFLQSPPMGFPSFINLEIPTLGLETLRSSTVSVAPSTPAYASHDTHLLQHPHPRLPSGLKEPVVSSIAAFSSATSDAVTSAGALPPESLDIPTIMQQDSNALDPTNTKHMGNQSFAGFFPPMDVFSLNPSVSASDPPPVPDSFPREPVPQSGRGEGWPYAPQGWPKPDDKWGWRVGKRASPSLLWIDRYVTLPTSLLKGRRTIEFASRKSLVEYCKLNFPQMTDPNNIFKAFDWKIPAPKDLEVPDKRGREPIAKRDKPPPTDGDENWLKPKKQCRAGNPHCILTKGKDSASESLGSLVCHICCSEPDFCPECKCILCCEIFRPNADDFSVVRCRNLPVAGQGICGHAAHLECALNSQLAGVIKKNGLDLEYICRRCDRKTDLRDTVSHLVDAMDQNATQVTVESILQLALRAVQDPEDEAESTWATLIADALKKIREGAVIAEVYKELTEQLHGLQSGQGVHDSQMSHQVFNWSRTMGRERALEDSPHPSEADSDKLVMSVGSPDLSTLQIQEKSQSRPLQQGGSNDMSPNDALTVCHRGDGVAIISLQPVLNVEPSDHLLCIPSLSSRLNQSVCKPPTLSIEEHIRQCEAITDRVKGAGLLRTPPNTLKVLNSDPSLSRHLFITGFGESEVVETSHCGDSSRAGEDDVVSGQIVEAPSVELPAVSSLGTTLVAGLEAKYERQISEALEKLERAQAAEYASAKASLNAQKSIVIEQYRKLDNVFGENENGQVFPHQLLKDQKDEPRAEIELAVNPVWAQVQEGQNVFESMLAISHGFGQVSKEFLRQFFS